MGDPNPPNGPSRPTPNEPRRRARAGLALGGAALAIVGLLALGLPALGAAPAPGGAALPGVTHGAHGASVVPAATHSWKNITSTAGQPGARYDAAMAYDAADGVVLLFGGNGGLSALNDTWEFSHGHWTQLKIAGPSPRSGAAMAYDAADGYVVLFGGMGPVGSSTVFFSDTWTFVNGTWKQLSPSTSPAGRYDAQVAYDGAAKDVAIGGGADTQNLSDMWTFHAGSWTQVPLPAPRTAGNPFHGRYSAMAYDRAIGKLVHFGGTGFSGNATYVFAHGNWTLLAPKGSPAARFGPSLAFDPALRTLVLFGGETTPSTWGFAAGNWTTLSVTSQASARQQAAMVYDPSNGSVVLFGGISFPNVLGDTWVLN